jgi:hypothetical protein
MPMLSVIYAECRSVECRYAECRNAECRGALECQQNNLQSKLTLQNGLFLLRRLNFQNLMAIKNLCRK